MLVQNYGLFWRRDDVHWGYGGHLKGVLSTNKTDGPVDFRAQQGVYALYDQSFHLVYVGQAGANDNRRLFDRLKDHTRDALADRWSRFSWFGVRWVKQDGELSAEKDAAHPQIGDVLNHIEAILIYAAEPPLNRQGGRFGDSVEQYFQYRDEESLGPTVTEMIRDLWSIEKQRK